jgi:hypothetical protein
MKKTKNYTGHIDAVEEFLSRPRSINEISDWLNCTPRFLYREATAGRLKVRKLSHCLVRVMPADLKRWLDDGATVK